MSTEKSGAQIHAEIAETARIIKAISDEMGLRKWVAERTLQLLANTNGDFTPEVIKECMESIYGFITMDKA